jgi:uncharacterized iron-regulated protein
MLGKRMAKHQSVPCLPLVRFLRNSVPLGVALISIVACASGEPATSQLLQKKERFHEWQVIDVINGQAVRMDDWMRELAQQDVVYLGEEHHNRFHIEAALQVLRGLIEQGRKPTLAMEMFGWDGQLALDRYVSGQEFDKSAFLEQVRWLQNWGGPFADYEPLVQFAKDQQLSLVAMNPPKTLVKMVVKKGLMEAKSDPEMAHWGMRDESIVDDPLYRELIMRQLQQCHGGEDSLYQSMYEASMVRDEGMAKTIVDRLAARRLAGDIAAGPLVSYTGGGHIQYQLPVPKRVMRRARSEVRQRSIYMTSYEKDRASELEEMIRDKIADYVWLTPIGAQGPPRRCR